MQISVRAYLLNDKEEILLVKHAPDEMWVLPGGHLEEIDHGNIYSCLEREIEEELGLDITVIGSENEFSDSNVASFPLPISIHKVAYEHRNKGNIKKLEYWFFARSFGEIDEGSLDADEIYEHCWVSDVEFGLMESNVEVHQSMQEVYAQNADLLELL